MISANHGKVEGLKPIVKSLYPLLFLYCRISFESSVPFSKSWRYSMLYDHGANYILRLYSWSSCRDLFYIGITNFDIIRLGGHF